jgi:hypothetical protein
VGAYSPNGLTRPSLSSALTSPRPPLATFSATVSRSNLRCKAASFAPIGVDVIQPKTPLIAANVCYGSKTNDCPIEPRGLCMFVDKSDISSETTMENPPIVPISPPFVPEPSQSNPIHLAE